MEIILQVRTFVKKVRQVLVMESAFQMELNKLIDLLKYQVLVTQSILRKILINCLSCVPSK